MNHPAPARLPCTKLVFSLGFEAVKTENFVLCKFRLTSVTVRVR